MSFELTQFVFSLNFIQLISCESLFSVTCGWGQMTCQIHQFIFNYEKKKRLLRLQNNCFGAFGQKKVVNISFVSIFKWRHHSFSRQYSLLTWTVPSWIENQQKTVCIVIVLTIFMLAACRLPFFVLSLDRQLTMAKVFQGLAYESTLNMVFFPRF